MYEIGWQLYLLLFCGVVMVPCLGIWALCRVRRWPVRTALWSLVAATTTFMTLTWAISSNSVILAENQLALKAGFYQTQINNIDLASSAINILPANQLGEFAPLVAVNGIRLPDYQVGWYLLQNRKLAFVMLIGPQEEVSLVRSGDMTAVVGGNLFSQSGRIVAAH